MVDMDYLEEDEFIGIRRITEEDKGTYYKMSKARSVMSGLYDDIFEMLWEKIISGSLVMFVSAEKRSNSICGFCQLDMQNPSVPEIGIDMIDEYMNMGYGTRTVSAVLKYVNTWDGIEYFIWKADKDNIKSRKIAEHLGGKSIRTRRFLPEPLIQYGLEKGILQEEDLTMICEYKIYKS